MDYYELTLQGKNLSQYVNMLSQPASFYEHVERNAQWMRNLWLNRKNYYKQIVDESIKTKENNDLLKALADQNIFVDLDQFADWKEDHENLPDYFIDASSGSERIIPKGSLMYDKYASLFEQVARMQEYAAAGDPVDIEGQFEEAKNDLMDKKAKELDEAETNFKSDIKEETGSTVEELEEQQAQLEAQREQQTKVKDSRDFTKANTAFQEILEVLKSDDPAVVDRAITEFLRKEILTTENEEGEVVPVTEDELQASLDEFVQNPQFVKSSIIPKIQLYPETYDLELRKVAGGRAAALEALIEQELLLLEETAAEKPVAEEVPVEEPNEESTEEPTSVSDGTFLTRDQINEKFARSNTIGLRNLAADYSEQAAEATQKNEEILTQLGGEPFIAPLGKIASALHSEDADPAAFQSFFEGIADAAGDKALLKVLGQSIYMGFVQSEAWKNNPLYSFISGVSVSKSLSGLSFHITLSRTVSTARDVYSLYLFSTCVSTTGFTSGSASF